MKDDAEIIKLYELYGFSVLDQEKDFIVVLRDYGYFKNLELIYEDESKINKEKIKNRYISVGYKEPNYYHYESIEQLHDNLFKGFFKYEERKHNAERNYRNFKEEKKNTLLVSDYSYIPCAYSIDNKRASDKGESLIMRLIGELKSSNGFFILEAAAGYGKTCTVYELMNEITKEKESEIFPLFIELSRNRSAKIFRYILNDEIIRNKKRKNSVDN